MPVEGKNGKGEAKESFSQLKNLFIELEDKVDAITTTPPYNPQKHNDETRSKIALLFVWGFFIIIGAALIGVPIYNPIAHNYGVEILSLKDILLAISGLISGPLGFVIGHYFKSDTK